jgi:hypothetical protein
MKKIPLNVKCDCGETRKKHFNGEGACKLNGCTWFHPNFKYVIKNRTKDKQQSRIPVTDEIAGAAPVGSAKTS